MQADGLEIEAAAKRRLADEYDAAQAAGQVASPRDGNLGRSNGERPATASDIGLTRKEVHDARQFRDAEVREPGKGSGLGPFHPAQTQTTTAVPQTPSLFQKRQFCAGFGMI